MISSSNGLRSSSVFSFRSVEDAAVRVASDMLTKIPFATVVEDALGDALGVATVVGSDEEMTESEQNSKMTTRRTTEIVEFFQQLKGKFS